MNKLDKQYLQLVQDILDYGVEKKDRTGTGTKSIFGYTIRHKMSDGFPLLTTKKMAWKTLVTELLWFLRGDTNIKYLVDNDCHIWDGDAWANYEKNAVIGDVIDSHYEPATDKWHLYIKEEFINMVKKDERFAKKWGELGPIYGKQWRNWKKPNHLIGPCEDEYTTDLGFISKEEYEIEKDFYVIDQIANLINELKTNPDSRRLMVSAWNVGELDQMVLPPCHYGFQVYTRELSLEERCSLANFAPFDDRFPDEDGFKWDEHTINIAEDWLRQHHTNLPTRAISLMWNQRSVDVGLGLGFNIASYGLLLEIIAKQVNMVPEELIGNLGDTHLYLDHVEPIKEQLTREPFELPKLVHMKTDEFWDGFDVSLFGHLDPTDFTLENYQSHPTIKLPLSN